MTNCGQDFQDSYDEADWELYPTDGDEDTMNATESLDQFSSFLGRGYRLDCSPPL
jgi:hypothetical protein